MKRILFIFALVLLGLNMQVKAQKVTDLLSTFSLTIDTITDTGTLYMTAPKNLTGNYVMAISILATNLTGTTAGTAVLEQSVNGTGYFAASTDTLTLVTAVTVGWNLTLTPSIKYRVKYIGSGTHTSTIKGDFTLKDIVD